MVVSRVSSLEWRGGKKTFCTEHSACNCTGSHSNNMFLVQALSASKAFTLCRVAETGGLIASFSSCQLEFVAQCNVSEATKEIYYYVFEIKKELS